MRILLSPIEMRDMEREYMSGWRIPSIELMERAADQLHETIVDKLSGCEGHSAYFACGPGGNGGDGYAAARLFASAGGKAVVISSADESGLTGDAAINCARAHATPRCFFSTIDELDGLPAPDVWVDALFGIGLTRPLSGDALTLIRRMNADGHVVAVDIPSGLDAETGAALGEAVMADTTITFEYEKLGHCLGDGPDHCGEIVVKSIGIPQSLAPKTAALLVEDRDIAPLRAPRKRNTHKGTYGKLVIVAGSVGMAGAGAIAANAALRTGAGLVTVACPASIVPVIQVLAPCATCVPLPESEGAISADAAPILTKLFKGADAIAIGPGLSINCASSAVDAALLSGVPAVFDADALNLISLSRGLHVMLDSRHIITPHPGEARRLLDRKLSAPVFDAESLQYCYCTALLKGAATVIAGTGIHISQSGTPGMAKGSSGDALTGIIGALLANGHRPEAAAWMGSHVHGLAGEAAAAVHGERSMTALDLIDQIGSVLSDEQAR